MNKSILIESSQEQAVKNYLIDYPTLDANKNINDDIQNHKWKTRLPHDIKLEVGDTIELHSAMIKSKGLSDESIELIGTAENHNITDNKIRIETGYYISNNWDNNLTLPYSWATLKNYEPNWTGPDAPQYGQFRTALEQDDWHKYNISEYNKLTKVYKDIDRIWWSDYGGPSMEDGEIFNPLPTPAPLEYWRRISPINLLNNYATNVVQNAYHAFSKPNDMCCGNLAHYTPSETRLYIGPDNWGGPYNHGRTSSYHNLPAGETMPIFNIKTSNADITTNLGFNSPVVIGQKITEELSYTKPNEFIKPKIIDLHKRQSAIPTTYKDYWETDELTNYPDNTLKTQKTSCGKMYYDLVDGVVNFSPTKADYDRTGIAYPTTAQRNAYTWNCMASGDYKRTQAMSELYSNLYLAKNVDTLNLDNIENASFFTGTRHPSQYWTTENIAGSSSYPSSQPYELGEQMVLYDDLEGFSINWTTDELNKQNRIDDIVSRQVLDPGLTEPAAGYLDYLRPTTNDKHLNLQDNNVIMTNMIANNANFEKLKRVRELLELPSDNTYEIDYNNQDFKDSLYMALEIGRLDDRYTQTADNILNYYDITKTPTHLPPFMSGISLPVALPSVKNVADEYFEKGNEYQPYQGFDRIPLFAGLFCDENEISREIEKANGAVNSTDRKFTLLKKWRSNHMYKTDLHSRYSNTRTPKSGNLTLPSTTKFSFKDNNGNYYDDTKIKENDIGICVAYRDEIETGQELLEFGLGRIAKIQSWGWYSVDTTSAAPNYTINAGTYVNPKNEETPNFLCDNTIASDASIAEVGTAYFTQNSTNEYSETTNKVDITASKAVVLEYAADDLITPSKIRMWQEAQPNASDVFLPHSTFPKKYIFQARAETTDDWLELSTQTLTIQVPFNSTQNPQPLSSLTGQFDLPVNNQLNKYRYFRWIFTETFNPTINRVGLGCMAMNKSVQTERIFGDNDVDFDATKLSISCVDPSTLNPIPSHFVNFNPTGIYNRLIGRGNTPSPSRYTFDMRKAHELKLGCGISLATAGASVSGTAAGTGTSLDKMFDNQLGDITYGWKANSSSTGYIRVEFTTGFVLSMFKMFPPTGTQTNSTWQRIPGKFRLYGSNTAAAYNDVSAMTLLLDYGSSNIRNYQNSYPPTYSVNGVSASSYMNEAFSYMPPVDKQIPANEFKYYTLQILFTNFFGYGGAGGAAINEMAFFAKGDMSLTNSCTIDNIGNLTDNRLGNLVDSSTITNAAPITPENAVSITYEHDALTQVYHFNLWFPYYFQQSYHTPTTSCVRFRDSIVGRKMSGASFIDIPAGDFSFGDISDAQDGRISYSNAQFAIDLPTFGALSAANPCMIGTEYDTPTYITHYQIWGMTSSSLTTRLDDNPGTWELRGAVDKTTYESGTYDTLHTISGYTSANWDNPAYYTGSFSSSTKFTFDWLNKGNKFEITTPGAYGYYVLFITSTAGDPNVLGFSEWNLYDERNIPNIPRGAELYGSTDNSTWTLMANGSELDMPFSDYTTDPNLPTTFNQLRPFVQNTTIGTSFKYFRMIINQTGYITDNKLVNIGEIELMNDAPLGWNLQNGLLDFNQDDVCDISLNSTDAYSTSTNKINWQYGTNALALEYDFAENVNISNFAIWAGYNMGGSLAELRPKVYEVYGWTGSAWVGLTGFNATTNPTAQLTSPTMDIDTSLAYLSAYTSTTNQTISKIKFVFNEMFAATNTSNRMLIPNLMVAKHSNHQTIQNVPYIGFICRDQISGVGKYKTPLPTEGEFYGISPSFQNNHLNYIFNPQKAVNFYDWTARNSYNASTQTDQMCLMIGAADATCEFDESNSRMGFSKLHTLMRQGQSTTNMLRMYEGMQDYTKPIVVPDGEASNEVIKFNRRRFEVNSARASFTEQIPAASAGAQIYPISNKYIRSQGATSASTGMGILNIYAGKKDGTWQELNPLNNFTYRGTLLDKLGFDLQQLKPLFGQQNLFFNRGNHNKYLSKDDGALNIYNNSVYPLTTNAFISGAVNPSLYTNNLNFNMTGGIGVNNTLEKSIPQTSDSIIGLNLPQKFSYSHLLVYSNIIPKYNWIGGSEINRLPCIGYINRSYQTGDYIFLNDTTHSYSVDLSYNISEIDIDIRQSNGLPAPISPGSTIILKINKTKPIPLDIQKSNNK